MISIKLLAGFIEIILRHGCSPVNFLHIFRATFPKNTSRWKLLRLVFIKFIFVHSWGLLKFSTSQRKALFVTLKALLKKLISQSEWTVNFRPKHKNVKIKIFREYYISQDNDDLIKVPPDKVFSVFFTTTFSKVFWAWVLDEVLRCPSFRSSYEVHVSVVC